MAESKKVKVMDVSKPGQTAPDASGKPVIVGHKPMIADPMVSKDDSKGESIEVKKGPSSRPLAQTGKKLEPISDDMKPEKPKEEPKPEEEKPTEGVETKPAETPEPAKSEGSTEPSSSEAEEKKDTDDTKDSKEKPDQKAAKEIEAENERQARIEELVDSKKYFVKIEGGKSNSFGTFFVTVFVILLVGVGAMVLLIDAEILDLGIGLPFNLIK